MVVPSVAVPQFAWATPRMNQYNVSLNRSNFDAPPRIAFAGAHRPMPSTRMLAFFLTASLLAVLVSCRARTGANAESQNGGTPPPTMPHGDHNPRHGGTVWMHGDLHYEVLLGPDGRYQVYFSDARRAELPAAVASNVTITVTRKKQPPEPVPLHVDDTGESWIGYGKAVDVPEAVARVSYELDGKVYWIDLPFQPAKPVPATAR